MNKNVPSKTSKSIIKTNRKINPEDAIDYELPKGLTKGKYDIDFAIGICDMIISHCEQHKFSSSLYISLNYSLEKLKKMLEQEKSPKNHNPVILFTCPQCKAQEIIGKMQDSYQCLECGSDCYTDGRIKKPQIEYLQD